MKTRFGSVIVWFIAFLFLAVACSQAPEEAILVTPGQPPVQEAGKAMAPPPMPMVTGGENQPLPSQFNTEEYGRIDENPFQLAGRDPLSTFSIDVDTASYANVRRMLIQEGQMPPIDAVRIEEMINYFEYDYPSAKSDAPFSVDVTVSACPWSPEHQLMRVGLKGREIKAENRPPSNLVLLLDVSGSMSDPNKLPLLRRAMQMLVRKLNEKDRVAIVVYAGASGLVLPSTSCSPANVAKIMDALERLEAGGSTAGSEGIQLAYKVAEEHIVKGGINRVILCTDGDFNVGVTSQGDLTRLIEEKAAGGGFLTVLGFGMGNLKDSTMEQLADKGNGNYGYIDTINEARKLLVDQISGTLITIAKDVKIQVEFNPAEVQAYRLVGYENRMLRSEDFNDDKKDAGEIGAGHMVTAFYELVPPGVKIETPGVDPLKYQTPAKPTGAAAEGEIMTLKLRYKAPDGDESKLLTFPILKQNHYMAADRTEKSFRFAAAVAEFGLLLRDSKYKGQASYDQVIELAQSGRGEDPYGYEAEFVNMVRTAKELAPRKE